MRQTISENRLKRQLLSLTNMQTKPFQIILAKKDLKNPYSRSET
jgi:hypothetical protein